METRRGVAFAKVMLISLLIQGGLNSIFQFLGFEHRVSFYEIALVWMFCK